MKYKPGDTEYPAKYAHVVSLFDLLCLCFYFLADSYDIFTHIPHSCFINIGAILTLPGYVWMKSIPRPDNGRIVRIFRAMCWTHRWIRIRIRNLYIEYICQYHCTIQSHTQTHTYKSVMIYGESTPSPKIEGRQPDSSDVTGGTPSCHKWCHDWFTKLIVLVEMCGFIWQRCK